MQMPYYNPSWPQQQHLNNTNNMFNNTLPQYNIVQVNGENGANAFQMGPNSQILLLDETAPIVWFVQTDGAGYKTVTPYTITPYKAPQPVDLHSLEDRLTALEEKVNAQSHFGTSKPAKKQQSPNPNESANTAT